MLIVKPLLWVVTVVSVVVAAASNTCSRDLKPQPVGIDFGANSVIATYAHTSKNLTTISWLTPPTYQPIIFRLRLEDFEAKQTAKILWGVNKKRDNALQRLKDTSQAYLSPILTPVSAKFTALKTNYPVLGNATSWLSQKSSSLLGILKSRFSKPWFNEDLTMQDVKNAFMSILTETKISAASHGPETGTPNTTISFAIFSVPDFFNKTLCDLVIEAAKEVGIESPPVTIARTISAGMAAQKRELLAEDNAASFRGLRSQFKYGNTKWNSQGMRKIDKNHPVPTSTAVNLPAKRPERILIVDQGRFYAALRTYEVEDRTAGATRALMMSRAYVRRKGKEEGVFQQRYLPLDPYGSQTMDSRLYQRVLDRDLALKEEIKWGADQQKLQDEVENARLLIKDALDREVGLLDQDAAGEREKDVDRHHEEWPLNLNGWSASGRDLQIVLRWEDVLAVEDEFVDKFAEAVHMFLVTLRRFRTRDEQTTHPETIHTAVILTDHIDGHLLTRAITQALGKDVRIVGGNLASMTLAAEGAAKLALRRLESWEEMRREEWLMEFLGSGSGRGEV
ncbi:hypothetical protein BKA64DRAFT_743515 [Cadophora sp. MPI-SDFR-AT-0126]|nr:hypothetical protein BKA64DRAFT_743515 [Leotiomycetes sp. MPI-SDFR-AT-0126]